MTKQSKFFSQETGCRVATKSDVILQFLKTEEKPCTVKQIIEGASWGKSGAPSKPHYVISLLWELEQQGWVEKFEKNDGVVRYEYKGHPEVIIKPKPFAGEVKKDDYVGIIAPPRIIEFEPYVPEPEPAYRPGAMAHKKYKSKGVL